jgi:tryptophan 2,3-dioxygenase
MEILSVRAELFHADGQRAIWTDMTNLIVAFRNFANAPKKYWILLKLAVKILLTSRCCILYIYSTNICTEYFKHAA